MCHGSTFEFFVENATPGEFRDKRVLEIGSKYVNGSVRPLVERFSSPKEYIGVDVENGRYVDLVLPAERLIDAFGSESFDVIIATEVLEHIRDWTGAVTNIKKTLKRNGLLFITTRSSGFPYHAHPHDYWRYEVDDMRSIFSDFETLKLQKDPLFPGVFLKAMKPSNWKPVSLEKMALYSIITGNRTRIIPEDSTMAFHRKLLANFLTSRYTSLLPRFIVATSERSFTGGRIDSNFFMGRESRLEQTI